MSFKFFSRNYEILPMEEAVIPLASVEYSYGFGVYENLKVRNAITYFLNEHMDRLDVSARIIGLEHAFAKKKICFFYWTLSQN